MDKDKSEALEKCQSWTIVVQRLDNLRMSGFVEIRLAVMKQASGRRLSPRTLSAC